MDLALEVEAIDWLARPKAINDHWHQRTRYLGRNPVWRDREVLARDLRNGDPFGGFPTDLVLGAKRRYRWAMESFEAGYLDAAAFYREAERWDRSVSVFRSQRFHEERPLDTREQMARERVRLRHRGASEFVDLRAWRRLASAMQEYRERELAWEQARVARLETARQRKRLQEGRQTLRAIKGLLHGAVPSRQPASEPAMTSPT